MASLMIADYINAVNDGKTQRALQALFETIISEIDSDETGWADIRGNDAHLKSMGPGALGPTLKLEHDSVSPANSDVIARISWFSDDDGGTSTQMAKIDAVMADVGNASEDISLDFHTIIGATLTKVLGIANGLTLPAVHANAISITGQNTTAGISISNAEAVGISINTSTPVDGILISAACADAIQLSGVNSANALNISGNNTLNAITISGTSGDTGIEISGTAVNFAIDISAAQTAIGIAVSNTCGTYGLALTGACNTAAIGITAAEAIGILIATSTPTYGISITSICETAAIGITGAMVTGTAIAITSTGTLTGTLKGIAINYTGVTLGTQSNTGIEVLMHATYGGTGTEYAVYCSGDGTTVALCSDGEAAITVGGTVTTGLILGGTLTTGIALTQPQTAGISIAWTESATDGITMTVATVQEITRGIRLDGAGNYVDGILLDADSFTDGIHISGVCSGYAINITGDNTGRAISIGTKENAGSSLPITALGAFEYEPVNNYLFGLFTAVEVDQTNHLDELRSAWIRTRVNEGCNIGAGASTPSGYGVCGAEIQLKFYADGADTDTRGWQNSAVWAQLETQGSTNTVSFNDGTLSSAVFANVGLTKTTIIDDGAIVAAVIAHSTTSSSDVTTTGDFFGVYVAKSPASLAFDTGLVISDDVAATGIDIGACDAGIAFTGLIPDQIISYTTVADVGDTTSAHLIRYGTDGAPIVYQPTGGGSHSGIQMYIKSVSCMSGLSIAAIRTKVTLTGTTKATAYAGSFWVTLDCETGSGYTGDYQGGHPAGVIGVLEIADGSTVTSASIYSVLAGVTGEIRPISAGNVAQTGTIAALRAVVHADTAGVTIGTIAGVIVQTFGGITDVGVLIQPHVACYFTTGIHLDSGYGKIITGINIDGDSAYGEMTTGISLTGATELGLGVTMPVLAVGDSYSGVRVAVNCENPINSYATAAYFGTLLTGTQAGPYVYGMGSWLDLSGFTATAGKILAAQDNGIYQGSDDGEINNAKLIFGMRMECLLESSDAKTYPFQLNTNNKSITAIFECSGTELGLVTNGGVDTGNLVPLYEKDGNVYYVKMWTHS